MSRHVTSTALVAGLALVGCDFLGLGTEEDRANEAAVTIGATADLAPLMDAIPVSTADDAIDEVAAGFSNALQVEDPNCLTVETVGATMVATFVDCTLAETGYPIDGKIYLRDVVGDGQLATYAIVVEGLRLGEAASISASWDLTREVGGPTRWSGNLDVEVPDARSLGREVEVSWTEFGGCRTLDMGAELGFFGVTNLAVSGLEVCEGSCPDAGEAEISWDAGASAKWTYDGTDTAQVVIARGDRFDVSLRCTPR